MAKLDRTKPFGKIVGDEANGRCFEQNGHYFTSQGEEWVPPPPPADAPVHTAEDLEAAVAAAKKEAAAEAQKDLDARIAAAVASALAGAKGK